MFQSPEYLTDKCTYLADKCKTLICILKVRVKYFEQGQRSKISAFHLKKVANNRVGFIIKKDTEFLEFASI